MSVGFVRSTAITSGDHGMPAPLAGVTMWLQPNADCATPIVFDVRSGSSDNEHRQGALKHA
ncbi:MAG: hypothetical protein ACREPN_03760 [Rudaea sp.]